MEWWDGGATRVSGKAAAQPTASGAISNLRDPAPRFQRCGNDLIDNSGTGNLANQHRKRGKHASPSGKQHNVGQERTTTREMRSLPYTDAWLQLDVRAM